MNAPSSRRFLVLIPYFDLAVGEPFVWVAKVTGSTDAEVESRMKMFIGESSRALRQHLVEQMELASDDAPLDLDALGVVFGEPIICTEERLGKIAIELPRPPGSGASRHRQLE